MIHIILGMHRSGTSLLAGLLHHSGITMGEDKVFIPRPSPENPRGFYENILFRRLNDRILKKQGYIVKKWKPYLACEPAPSKMQRRKMSHLIETYNTRYSHWGWKDPRQMLTAACWFQLLQEMGLFEQVRIVFTIRHPLSVALSMKNRGNVETMEQGMLVWELYNRHCLQTIDEYKPSCFYLEMEDFSSNQNEVIKEVSNYTGVDISEKTYSTFFSNKLVRSEPDTETDIPFEITELYEEILRRKTF